VIKGSALVSDYQIFLLHLKSLP